MSDREVNGKQIEGEEWAAKRATAFPFPGNLSISLSACVVRVRLGDEDHHSWDCDCSFYYSFTLKSL